MKSQMQLYPLTYFALHNTLKPYMSVIISFQNGMDAAERMSELESMIGIVVQLGKKLGVSTPLMQIAYAVLKPG